MYSTCLFCHGHLGTNEAIEHFTVGSRLAFDAKKGRLRVVCAKCARWNLTPVEERWEAIEECERLFRDTHVRVSTAQVGMARLREGIGRRNITPSTGSFERSKRHGARPRRSRRSPTVYSSRIRCKRASTRSAPRAILLDSPASCSYLSPVMLAHTMPSATSYYYDATLLTGRERSRMR